MHKVRVNYSSCTGKNIYSSSGGAQVKKENRCQDPAVLDTTKEPPNIHKYTVFHTHKSGFCPKWRRRVEPGKGRRRRRRVAMQRQAWQEGSSNSSNHNTNGRQDVRRVQVQQKLKTETFFILFFEGKKRIGITDLLSSRSKLGDGGSSTVLAKSSIPGMFFTAVRY
jgi:hypothetical protein